MLSTPSLALFGSYYFELYFPSDLLLIGERRGTLEGREGLEVETFEQSRSLG